ncbi:MAG: restriction endonuclease subunit S, partial [Bacteroidales bacterium]|nr:restriction endonuclease subunit S [Bacteroidales bacterium]
MTPGPMKPSGIPWIGEIPDNWNVEPFKRRFRTRKGLSITKADLVENGIGVISYGQIHSKTNNGAGLNPSLIKFVPEKYLLSDSNALVSKGDFIFADTSEDMEGCGNCAYVDSDDQIFAGYHSIIASNESSNNKYFAYLFQTDGFRSQIRSVAAGIKVYSITQFILATCNLIVPPVEEQERIAGWLDGKCGEIDELIDVEQRMIESLQSY